MSNTTNTAAASGAEDLQDVVSKALRRAWQLGQTYWQQADSDSYRQNKQSGETQAVFVKLVDETRAALATPAQAAALVSPSDDGFMAAVNEMDGLYAAPAQVATPDMTDAYAGAREDLSIWKKRALEAEALNRKFAASVNSPSFMGEPAAPAQAAPVDAAAQEDAERYRWLREYAIGAYTSVFRGKSSAAVYLLTKVPALDGIGEETDAAIDAARAAQKGGV